MSLLVQRLSPPFKNFTDYLLVKATDDHVLLFSQILSNITVSFFSFRREINIIRKKSAILASLAALEYTSVPVATMVSIITLVLTLHQLMFLCSSLF